MKTLSTLLLVLLLVACGTQQLSPTHPNITAIDSYVASVNANKSLDENVIEGTLTDPSGFNDVGGYEYYPLFDDTTLYRIRYYENTHINITEIYYYKNNKLVFIDATWYNTQRETTQTKKVYLINNKVVYELGEVGITTKQLIIKGKGFIDEFKNQQQ